MACNFATPHASIESKVSDDRMALGATGLLETRRISASKALSVSAVASVPPLWSANVGRPAQLARSARAMLLIPFMSLPGAHACQPCWCSGTARFMSWNCRCELPVL